MKPPIKTRLLAKLIAALIKLWLKTLRVERKGPPLGPWGVVAFLHGEQLPLLLLRPIESALFAPISLSRDGTLQAEVMRHFNVSAVRGSSSRGALRALLGLERHLKGSDDVVLLIAVDGPRGPYGEPKPGAAHLALRANAPLWFCRAHCAKAWRLKSWDRFCLPRPFSRVSFNVTPLSPSAHSTQASLHELLRHMTHLSALDEH